MPAARQTRCSTSVAVCDAGLRLLAVYAGLAQRREHLLSALLLAQTSTQWAHYPNDDAIDTHSGFQWFYHSHSPADRPGSLEHGHIHLFAQRKRWVRRLKSKREIVFAQKTGGTTQHQANTRHLLAIGLDAKGIPISLFTVNSWVTGDLMLSAATSAQLLERMTLNTGYPDVDAVIESVIGLFSSEIQALLQQRDATLDRFKGRRVLANKNLEVLSTLAIDVDAKCA